MSGLIHHLTIWQSPVFLVNSRLGLFSAAHLRERPLSRSYRSNLPSSLAMDLPSALVYSTQPPVSVYGTGACMIPLKCFSWKYVYSNYQIPRRFTVLSGSNRFYTLKRTIPSVRVPFTLSSHSQSYSQCQNINWLVIGKAFRHSLRARLTLIRLALIRKPWSFGEEISHLLYRYLCLHLLLYKLHKYSRT